jgi:hypothetical protein
MRRDGKVAKNRLICPCSHCRARSGVAASSFAARSSDGRPKDVWSCRANALKGTLLFRPWLYLITTEMKFDQTEMNALEVPRVRANSRGEPQFIPKFHRKSADGIRPGNKEPRTGKDNHA